MEEGRDRVHILGVGGREPECAGGFELDREVDQLFKVQHDCHNDNEEVLS